MAPKSNNQNKKPLYHHLWVGGCKQLTKRRPHECVVTFTFSPRSCSAFQTWRTTVSSTITLTWRESRDLTTSRWGSANSDEPCSWEGWGWGVGGGADCPWSSVHLTPLHTHTHSNAPPCSWMSQWLCFQRVHRGDTPPHPKIHPHTHINKHKGLREVRPSTMQLP